jgi:MraZ protein
MTVAFRGRFEHTVDAKGRTSLPARWRDELAKNGESQLVITMSFSARCLVAYPMREWEAFEERLAALPSFDNDVIALKRRYISPAVECEIDKLGRVLLPSSLREYAELTRDVLWAGMGKNVELWDQALFKAVTEKPLEEAAQLAMGQRLAGLGL